jgi:hypothetical protein
MSGGPTDRNLKFTALGEPQTSASRRSVLLRVKYPSTGHQLDLKGCLREAAPMPEKRRFIRVAPRGLAPKSGKIFSGNR